MKKILKRLAVMTAISVVATGCYLCFNGKMKCKEEVFGKENANEG